MKAITMCIFMTIKKEELESIFELYPQQGKFLRAIARQRMLTTNPEDLLDFEENMFEVQDGENVFVENFEDQEGTLSSKTINFLAEKNQNGLERSKTMVANQNLREDSESDSSEAQDPPVRPSVVLQ